jgi:hypothetical protein
MGLHVVSPGLTTRSTATEAVAERTAACSAAWVLRMAASLAHRQSGNPAGGNGIQHAWEGALGAGTGGRRETGYIRHGRCKSTGSYGRGKALATVSSLIVC